MKPVSPVIPSLEHLEIVIAKDQPEYLPLPALPLDSGMEVLTRWQLTLRERIGLIFGRDIFLHIWTFRRPLQPVMLSTQPPYLEVKGLEGLER